MICVNAPGIGPADTAAMSAFPGGLRDAFGRRVDYLRVSVTDRCDLRCSYCLPKGFCGYEAPSHWLTLAEIERVVAAFARLGVERVRLTGGEPLLRRGLTDLARAISAHPGVADLSLSTNATQLARHARALREAGVTRLNVSLDTLDPRRFERITGRNALADVLAGLEAARAEGFAPIKINLVAMAGVNDDEIDAVVSFCAAHGFVLRLIEAMPVGETGRAAAYLDLQPVRKRLAERFALVDSVIPGGGPARYLSSPDGRFNVGFITPLSQHFCETCNRLRLAVDGTLHLCLGHEDRVPLAPLLRGGAADAELDAAIIAAMARKPERHLFRESPGRLARVMAQTGG